MKPLSLLLLALSLALLASCITGGTSSSTSRESSGSGAGPSIEGKRSVTARIFIPSADEGIDVRIVTSSGEEINAAWPRWAHEMYVNTRWHGTVSVGARDRKILRDRAALKIDPSQEYHIDLLTQILAEPGLFRHEVLRISKNDRILIDASICQVHKLPMKRQMEEVSSADSYPESFFPRQKREFPNDGNFYSGSSSKSDPTWKCPECRADYDSWTKGHDGK